MNIRRASPGTRPSYEPALDGLRGLCLLAVLFFHAGFAWMPGGFLGVSTFFTLSGFLITSLLVSEWERSTTVSIPGFWTRRLRRLMPAAILGIGIVVASSPYWLPADEREKLTFDALAALAYAINWRFVQADYAYEAIFSAPSPLQHFWSLAIEAQFYLVYPLVVVTILRFSSRPRVLAGWLLAGILACLAVTFAIPLTAHGVTRIYYGSDTRAPEILTGALLALGLGHERLRTSQRATRWLPWAGAAALAALVGCWIFVSLSDDGLYRGGFTAYAMLSGLVVASAVAPHGIVRGALSLGGLRWLGQISYGAYVYHWPVFLLLSESSTGLGPITLFAVRLVATLALADASYRFVESPIRRGTRAWASSGPFLLAAGAGLAALVLVLDPIPLSRGASETFPRSRPEQEVGPSHAGARIALFGDSTAFSLWPGLSRWARTRPDAQFVKGDSRFACGLITFGEHRVSGRWAPLGGECRKQPETWETLARADTFDIGVVLIGAWDTRTWRMGEGSAKQTFGNKLYDAFVSASIGERMDALTSAEASVVWLTMPHLGMPPLPGPFGKQDVVQASGPARVDRLNELIREQASARPKVRVVDLAGYVERWPGGELDRGLRKDGVHFSEEGSTTVVSDWLGEQILPASGAPAGRPVESSAPAPP